eukprot:TRINITY_DN4317_c0_g2_i1.p1 TRINITY_DN4317_c0_g2~~TRINITY_DN4317_c0_g2_i1.p1  ORF type:complete len:701 (-),score=160.28 TRINITY_DN4317_c0_g2_i1:239-2341(-)
MVLVYLVVLFVVGMVRCDVPYDWRERVLEAEMLYTDIEPNLHMMASVGNGYISTVVGGEIIYVSGVYNGLNSVGPSHRAIIPATNSFTVNGGRTIGAAIDIERATYYRRVTVDSALIEQRWYAHRTRPSVLVYEMEVNNIGNPTPVSFTVSLNTTSSSPDFTVENTSFTTDYIQYAANINTPEEPNGFVTSISVVLSVFSSYYTVSANDKVVYRHFTIIRSNLDSKDPTSDSINDFKNAVVDADKLHGEHTDEWLRLWESRIEVSGDFRLAQVINSSTYYILSSVRHDWPYSLSPGSLSSNGYNGHVFWDCETWMYPSILLTHPDIANGGLLEYRIQHTDGAALKAKTYNKGYQGFMFPWESAFTGEETCPLDAPTGELEQHITGDIAFALKQYWSITNDLNWLKRVFPVIYGIAEFWASRVEFNTTQGLYVINGVIPPDEYAVNVNNSVYTNVVAMISLDFAVNAAGIVGEKVPDNWSTISSNMKIPFDDHKGIHLEYDGYSGALIKQADVILLGYPLMWSMPRSVRYNDLFYYQNVTDRNGPAMTFAMEVVGWLELGLPDTAAQLWKEAWANAKDPYMVWTETPTGGTVNFITGAGGFLQAVLNGYGGIRIFENSLQFNPQLPPSVDNVIFNKINYRGNTLKLSYDNKQCQLTKTNNESDAQQLVLTDPTGETYVLKYNITISFNVNNSKPFIVTAST